VTHYPGWLFTLVGPAGAGKNHLMRAALARVNGLSQLPTATTRPIRPTEQEGREHFYLTRAAFEQLIVDNALLEYQPIHGNLYGMLRTTVEDALRDGRCVIADIDIFGALRARDLFPNNAISIFIQPPSIATLIERMRTRGDRDAEIAKRLVRVPLELANAPLCDYHILNDYADRASTLLVSMIESVMARRPIAQPVDDAMMMCAFRYVVAAIPVFGEQKLVRITGDAPTMPLPVDELYPHRAALAALDSALGWHADESDVIGGEPDGTFIPPMAFTAHENAEAEQITFIYHVRLPARIDAPPGWMWTPLKTPVAVPETV